MYIIKVKPIANNWPKNIAIGGIFRDIFTIVNIEVVWWMLGLLIFTNYGDSTKSRMEKNVGARNKIDG